MSKRNNLKDYLTDLYQGISSKKPGASRNPQDFRAEIESIKDGGDPLEEFDGICFTTGTPTEEDHAETLYEYDGKCRVSGEPAEELPIPEGYIKPSGDLGITENGTYDVTDKSSVTVAVEGESEDTPVFDGTIEIGGEPATDYIDYYENGKTEGIAEGRQAEWSEFWDTFQQNGELRKYTTVFRNLSTTWTVANLKPKYDIICEGDASQCFYGWENRNNSINLVAVFKSQGITLDTSKATYMTDFFAYGYGFIGELPTISCASAGANTVRLFRSVAVTKIEKVIVTEQTIYTDWFMYCGNLVEIRFEGAISNDISFAYCRLLSKASIQDIMQHLSETTTGKTATISLDAVNIAFKTSAGANDGSTSEEWLALVNTRPNWTISLLNL